MTVTFDRHNIPSSVQDTHAVIIGFRQKVGDDAVEAYITLTMFILQTAQDIVLDPRQASVAVGVFLMKRLPHRAIKSMACPLQMVEMGQEEALTWRAGSFLQEGMSDGAALVVGLLVVEERRGAGRVPQDQ
ncbi:hypothetical protein RvY_13912 [Ramazzottius varieornatus]|uniref:Uncharacterized protein n=1 Tax=Ramazzottius varieornatus TaxID=947166 RepID=A0A1D1VY15_RAMVA|nr:hypothetical protein RvY_13912 [Ramazzottius varieornatus]